MGPPGTTPPLGPMVAIWGVWEERVGVRASRAGPTLAFRPANPALGIRGRSRRQIREGTEEKGWGEKGKRGKGGEGNGKGSGEATKICINRR